MTNIPFPDALLMTPVLARGLKNIPMSFKMAAVAITKIERGQVYVSLPDGRSIVFKGKQAGKDAVLLIKDFAFIKRVLAQGDIGFAEGLMAGEWDTPDLAILLEVFSDNLELVPSLMLGGPLWMAINKFRHKFLKKNTKTGSKKNILAHYDLGNGFYSRWLDPSMTYSSAVYEQEGQDLTTAQMNKYRALAEKVELKPGQKVLEIGCGWGGFAEFAAREYGAHVTGVTISNEQHAYATQRVKEAGLADLVDIQLIDYRDIKGQYDAVVSIEMFEAVGEQYWATYFDKVSAVLKPGGKAALQIITIDEKLFDEYRGRADFIQSYVFPGGMLPTVPRLRKEVERAGMVWGNAAAFGISYADTLAVWAKNFLSEWLNIRELGFDERFRQLWRFYLAYCEAGFRTGRIDVGHFSFVKP
jgi:cyclopropane-fatty-acyl-phospholipid synthase